MPLEDLEASESKDDADLWFLPGPIEDEPDYLPPGPPPEAKNPMLLMPGARPRPGRRRSSPVLLRAWESLMNACAEARLAGGSGLP